MKMQEIRTMAKQKGVKIGKMNKTEAIRNIQRSEGNFDCFGKMKNAYCDQSACLFMDDCSKLSVQ